MLKSNHSKMFQCLRNGSFLLRRALRLPGILGFRFIVVLALNNAIVMQGEWGSCLFSCNSYPPFGANLSSPLLCHCDLADSKSKGEMCVTSLPCFQCYSQKISRWISAYMHVLWSWLVHSNCCWRIPSYFKNIPRWLALIGTHFLSVFLLHFTFLILEFLKNIGHTGIAGTKKWLDQAVFPCWSNYHTLAGE